MGSRKMGRDGRFVASLEPTGQFCFGLNGNDPKAPSSDVEDIPEGLIATETGSIAIGRLSLEEVKRVLAMATSLKARAMLTVSYGCGSGRLAIRAGDEVEKDPSFGR
jgi:hypothetical protein